MPRHQCPNCNSSNVASRMVNDRLRAADPSGESFEIALKLLAWDCLACKLCWQGQEAEAAKETAYEKALLKRALSRVNSYPQKDEYFGRF
jgi:hypothetical protein